MSAILPLWRLASALHASTRAPAAPRTQPCFLRSKFNFDKKKFSSLTGTCTVQKGSFCEQPSPNACDKQLHDTDVLCQIITRHYPRGNMHIACKITLHRRHDRIQSTLSRSKCADDYYCLMQQTTLDAHSVVSVSSTFRNQRKINGGSARYNMAVHTSCHFYGVLVINHRYQSSICIQPIQYFLLIPQTFKGYFKNIQQELQSVTESLIRCCPACSDPPPSAAWSPPRRLLRVLLLRPRKHFRYFIPPKNMSPSAQCCDSLSRNRYWVLPRVVSCGCCARFSGR